MVHSQRGGWRCESRKIIGSIQSLFCPSFDRISTTSRMLKKKKKNYNVCCFGGIKGKFINDNRRRYILYPAYSCAKCSGTRISRVQDIQNLLIDGSITLAITTNLKDEIDKNWESRYQNKNFLKWTFNLFSMCSHLSTYKCFPTSPGI